MLTSFFLTDFIRPSRLYPAISPSIKQPRLVLLYLDPVSVSTHYNKPSFINETQMKLTSVTASRRSRFSDRAPEAFRRRWICVVRSSYGIFMFHPVHHRSLYGVCLRRYRKNQRSKSSVARPGVFPRLCICASLRWLLLHCIR